MSLTVEESNFLRIYYLNLKVASKAVRVYFDSVHPPAGLANELANSSATLKGLRFITKLQLQTLYPSPASNVTSGDFDTTLIVCLLRNMTPRETAPVTGWDILPHPADTSKGADLARIKWYRNKLAHDGDGKLSLADLSQYWGDLECAIGRIGGPSMLTEAQSAHHIVLDRSLRDILNRLSNYEKEVHNFQMSQEDHTSMINNLQSVIDNQSTITEKRVDDLIRELVCKNDITFKEVDKQFTKHDEGLTKHEEMLTKHEEQLTKHEEQLATSVKEIDVIKKKQHDTHDSSGGRKHKRLEDDTKVLIKEDIREDTFVITKAVTESLSLLQKNGVLLITGCAGTGKSRIGRHVLHMYCTGDTSYSFIKLNILDEWEDMVSRQDNVVVLLDDIFGETNCIYNREKDTKILDKVHAYINKGNIKVIITIRDTVKRHCREVFENHRLFKFDLIDLSSDKYKLSRSEKHTILQKYMKSVQQSDYADHRGFVDFNGITILENGEVWKITEENPAKGFPLAVYQFVHHAKYFQLGSQFFDRPTEAMIQEMNDIRRKGRDHKILMMHYAVMVYTAINENCVNPDDSSIVIDVEKIIDAIYGETIKLNNCDISDAVNDLKGSYLVTNPNKKSYRFHHPTLLESVILSSAQIGEENMKNIIPLLSWSFIKKMVKPDAYIEKVGEVVLKIPTNCYKLLAYRLVNIYRSEPMNIRRALFSFVLCVIQTELLQHKNCLLLNFFLEAFENEDDQDKYIDVMSFEVHVNMLNKSFFLGNLLVSIAKTESQDETYSYILRKFNKIVKTSNNFDTTDFFKSALRISVYNICSTKDVRCVKATLDLFEEYKMPVLLDLGIDLDKIISYSISESMSVYKLSETNCIFLSFCIWKAYEAFNEPVLEHLLSKYNETPFDVNLFLKKIYNIKYWVVGISCKPLKWMIERFEDQKSIETDFILRIACQCYMFDTVEYLASRYDTFDALSCLEIFLDDDGMFMSGFDFRKHKMKDLFHFLFSKIDSSSAEMNKIVIATLHKTRVPDFLCETLLPFCINNEAILTLACKEAHFYMIKLILENSHIVNIQSALISVCIGKESNFWMRNISHDDVKLEIVKFIVGKYGYEQFDLKVLCQTAYQTRQFKIMEWFVLNFDIHLLDVHCIINSALACKKAELFEYILNKIDIASLNQNEVLKSVVKYFYGGCSTKILQILSSIWNSTADKEEMKIEEIVDKACRNKYFELLKWIHENCNSHVSIDANKVLILACENGRIDVAKWIFNSFERTSLEINEVELFMLACDNMSFYRYTLGKISMVKWLIESFEIKPFNTKFGLFKLLSFTKYQIEEIKDDFSKLVVLLLKKCFRFLSTEDTTEIVKKCLEHKYYDVVNWLLENPKNCFLDKQTILNKACEDAQIETIKMLNKYFHSLDMNEALIHACAVYDETIVCDYLLAEIDIAYLDKRRIVSTVFNRHVSGHVMKWILRKLSPGKKNVNKMLMYCCRCGKYNLLKYIFLKVHNEQLDIETALNEACLHSIDWGTSQRENLCVVDFLFQKLQNRSHFSSVVVRGLLEKKRHDVILYFLEEGYCRNIDMTNLLNEVCKEGNVKIVQWILVNVKHKELDIKSAFLNACTKWGHVFHLECEALLWHNIHDINLFEVNTVLNTMPNASSDWLHEKLRAWLLYIKTKNHRSRVIRESRKSVTFWGRLGDFLWRASGFPRLLGFSTHKN